MPKRFHSTEIWTEDWFISLSHEEKFLWFFILDDCDHAGIWKPNKFIFEATIRGQVDLKIALQKFNSDKTRIHVLPNGRWYVLDFISFQYGDHLNPKNRMHYSVIQLLTDNNVFDLNLTSIRPQLEGIIGPKDKDKDKDKDSSIKEGVQGEKVKRFIPPTLEEVSEYCRERKNSVDPQKWVDHYTANGFKVGKNPMKDWKAAVRTWEKNNFTGGTYGPNAAGIGRAERIRNNRAEADRIRQGRSGLAGNVHKDRIIPRGNNSVGGKVIDSTALEVDPPA